MSTGKLDMTGISIGASKSGIKKYLEALKTNILEDTIKKLDDTKGILDALDSGWQGKSKEKFKSQFEDTRNTISDELRKEYEDIENRIEEVVKYYYDQDEKLID